MKWMKWFLVLGTVVAVGLGATGCGGGDDGGGNSLTGTWHAQSLNGQPMPVGVALSITLNDNGTYTATTTYGGISAVETGTWSTEGGTLVSVHEGETEQVAYSLNGNTLTVSDQEGVFVLQRQ